MIEELRMEFQKLKTEVQNLHSSFQEYSKITLKLETQQNAEPWNSSVVSTVFNLDFYIATDRSPGGCDTLNVFQSSKTKLPSGYYRSYYFGKGLGYIYCYFPN